MAAECLRVLRGGQPYPLQFPHHPTPPERHTYPSFGGLAPATLDSGVGKGDSAGAAPSRPVGIISSKVERTPVTMSVAAPAATVMLTTLADGRIQLAGGTYPIKDQIRARGGLWNPAERVWTLPAGTDTAFVAVMPAAAASKPKTAAEIYRRVAAAVAPFKAPCRDGRCCSAAAAFWPADDYYGPAHYRCPHHGETRATYSGT